MKMRKIRVRTEHLISNSATTRWGRSPPVTNPARLQHPQRVVDGQLKIPLWRDRVGSCFTLALNHCPTAGEDAASGEDLRNGDPVSSNLKDTHKGSEVEAHLLQQASIGDFNLFSGNRL
jgi:hypothetical protein